MGLGGLQHYTIEPSDLERTKDFYCDVLGLENGDRPPLDFPGYWLYSGGTATVHLMGTRKPREGIVVRGTEKKYEDTGRLDHIAFAADDVDGVRKRLQSKGVKFRESIVPRTGDTQFFLYDPDGVGVELNFPEPNFQASTPRVLPGVRHQFGQPRLAEFISAMLSRPSAGGVAVQHRAVKERVPDKAASKPSLRHESVRVSTSLHDELEEPRRCGRIAGCRAFNPTPGHACPAIRAARVLRQSSPRSWLRLTISRMKVVFCVVVQAGKQRLGSIGHVALIDGTVVEELGLVAHLLDNVVRRVALGARDAQIEAIGTIMSEIVHCTVESGPVLLLLGRQVQRFLDPFDIGVAVGDDLLAVSVGAPFWVRTAACLVPFAPLAAFADFAASPCLASLRRRLAVALGTARQNAGDARHHANHAADRAAEHAADRPGRLVAFARAFLDPLNHLRIHAGGMRRAPAGPSRQARHVTAATGAQTCIGMVIIWAPSSIARLRPAQRCGFGESCVA